MVLVDRSGSDGESSTELAGQSKGGNKGQQAMRARSPLARHISDASTGNWTSNAVAGRLDMLQPSSEYKSSSSSSSSLPKTPRSMGSKKKVKATISPLQRQKERIASRSPTRTTQSPLRTRPQSPRRNLQSPRPPNQTSRSSNSGTRSPHRTRSLESPNKKTGQGNKDKFRMSPHRRRSAEVTMPQPSPKQSAKLIMSPSSTPKRQRLAANNLAQSSPNLMTMPLAPQLAPPDESPRSNPTKRQHKRGSSNGSLSKSTPGTMPRNGPDVDLSVLFHASLPTLPDSIMGGDHSVVGSIMPSAKARMEQRRPSCDLPAHEEEQESYQSASKLEPEQPPTKSEPRRGILRSLSLTMGLRGGKQQKSKKFSSSTVGGELDEKQVPTKPVTFSNRSTAETTRGISRKNSSSSTGKGIRGRLSRSRSNLMSRESTSLELAGKVRSETTRHSKANSSATSLPVDIENQQSLPRTSAILDIYRKPTGENDEKTDGYRIVHLVTGLDDRSMSVWDAVCDAHKSYPANRLFRVDASLERELQEGIKCGVLHVGSCATDNAKGLTIKQSFEYWKQKDLRSTVEAMVACQNKPHLSVQVEYANVEKVLEGGCDVFDRF